MTNEKTNLTAELGNSGSGRMASASFIADKLKLKHISECPHIKLGGTLINQKEPPNIPCLNELCFSIGEFFVSLDWAEVTEKQIDLMGKVMFRLDCACYNKILYDDNDQHNRIEEQDSTP